MTSKRSQQERILDLIRSGYVGNAVQICEFLGIKKLNHASFKTMEDEGLIRYVDGNWEIVN